MELKKINEQVWLTEVKLDDYCVRGAVIQGDREVVLVDTLSHPRDMGPLLPLIQGRTVTIVYTHGDWDHIWGTGALPWEDARILGHDLCLDRFHTDVPETLYEKQLAEPHLWEGVKLVPPNETFTDNFSLEVGSLVLTLHHLPGHTLDSIVVFLEEFGMLFMGDSVETPFPCLEKESPLSPWITKLQRWKRDPRLKMVIPAHGEIGGQEIIGHTIAYLQDLSAGNTPGVLEPLTDFYRETHGANIRFARDAGQKLTSS